MPVRAKQPADHYSPLIASLPDELRSFDSYADPRCNEGGHAVECGCRTGWRYPGGLFAYMSALSDFIGGDRRVGPVMNAAGISVAEWVSASAKRTHLSDL